MSYFTNENMISSKQYGFRPGFIASDCLIDLIEEITSSLDQRHFVVSLFLDLSKAFDTVNHQILLNKLKRIQLVSNLSNRKQQVHVNSVASDTCFISTGVPQGSILGPSFCCFTFFSTRLYADDTSLTASGSELDSLLYQSNHLNQSFASCLRMVM